MPIYAYRCDACGFAKDVLQKISDAPLSACPSCHADAFRKQLSAPGFQLKGSGWYATDFKSGTQAGKPAADAAAAAAAAAPAAASTSATSATPAAAPAAAPAASPAPAHACGAGCSH
jgi:putative FmdB family regulatory protein